MHFGIQTRVVHLAWTKVERHASTSVRSQLLLVLLNSRLILLQSDRPSRPHHTRPNERRLWSNLPLLTLLRRHFSDHVRIGGPPNDTDNVQPSPNRKQIMVDVLKNILDVDDCRRDITTCGGILVAERKLCGLDVVAVDTRID